VAYRLASGGYHEQPLAAMLLYQKGSFLIQILYLVRTGVRRFTHRSYSNKNPLRSAGDCSSGEPCLKLILAFQITTQLSNGGSTKDRHDLQKAAAVAGWHIESPAGPSAAYIHGGRSCLVLMGDSYNPNLDKKIPPACTGGFVCFRPK
jgi:hypothetical protein